MLHDLRCFQHGEAFTGAVNPSCVSPWDVMSALHLSTCLAGEMHAAGAFTSLLLSCE